MSATSPATSRSAWERNEVADEIVSRITEKRDELSDEEAEDEFITRYGEIEYRYVKQPKNAIWFIKPHALNYFKDGVLYRTKGRRGAAKTEMFLDLMYVGIIANLAGAASEAASGLSLLKYILFFIPAYTVWNDIKEGTNHYYNEDLSQKVYIVWILSLLTLYANSHQEISTGVRGAALTVVPYMLCRLSMAWGLFIYAYYIPEHRGQLIVFSSITTVTTCLWIPVIFISNRAKVGVAIAVIALEMGAVLISHSMWLKRKMKGATYSALHIEHEVERFTTFYTIAIGEFLYKTVATNPLGTGFSDKFARGIFLLIIAYVLFWFYMNGSTCRRAVHALRRSGITAIFWIYSHLPLIAAVVLAADAGGEIAAADVTRLSKPVHEHPGEEHRRSEVEGAHAAESEVNMYALSFFFTGSICVALVCLTILGLVDKNMDPPDFFYVNRFWRIIFKVPIGIIILCLSFAELNSTVLMGIITALLVLLLVYESVVSTPKKYLQFTSTGEESQSNSREEKEPKNPQVEAAV